MAKKICFISPSAYPLLDPDYGGGWSGGAEAQFVTLARGLQNEGYEVHFIVGDFGQKSRVVIDGITLHKSSLRYMGGSKAWMPLDLVRFLLVLAAVRADYHLIKVPRHLMILIATHCKLFGGELIFVGQKDTDIDEAIIRRQEGNLGWRLYRKAISMAAAVVAQTETQQRGFRELFGKSSSVIRNVLTLEQDPSPVKQDYVLWVGNSTADKQSQLVPEIVSALPDIQFRMIMSKSAGTDDSHIRDAAEKLDNFEYIGQVPFSEIADYYKGAALFISTSRCEGFPNTFLQSWQYRTPVVSLMVDPDDVTERYTMGRVSGSIEKMISDISEFMGDDQLRLDCGNNAYDYVQREHSEEAVLRAYLEMLRSHEAAAGGAA